MARKPRIFTPKNRKQCCGKNRYISKHEAETVATEQMIMKPDLNLSVYRCQCGCGDWHLTRAKGDD